MIQKGAARVEQSVHRELSDRLRNLIGLLLPIPEPNPPGRSSSMIAGEALKPNLAIGVGFEVVLGAQGTGKGHRS